MLKVPSLIQNVGEQPWCPISKGDGKEWLILNYMVPGNPPIQVICYYTASKEALDVLYGLGASGTAAATGGDGWKNSLSRFWASASSGPSRNPNYINERFKMIPNVVCYLIY